MARAVRLRCVPLTEVGPADLQTLSGAPSSSTTIPRVRRLLTGWGRTSPSAADVVSVRRPEQIDALIAEAARSARPLVPRGLGRSYGDAAQCAGGLVVDTTGLNHVLDSDLESGSIRVGAGASLHSLMCALVPRGWFVPVTPGTRFVTIGGAIAADIHGKNHHHDGSFMQHVTRLSIAAPVGRIEASPSTRASPDDGAGANADLFWATAGGMGLTGIVVEATIRLLPVETAWMNVDTERCRDLDDCMSKMESGDSGYRYSVAWIDCLARGRHMGRAVLTRGDHARLDDLPPRLRHAASASRFEPTSRFEVPFIPPGRLLNPVTVAAFNEMWFRKAPLLQTGHPEHMTTFFHPLDGIGAWNRLYGRLGFIQYQLVVPTGSAGEGVLRRVLERLGETRTASFLAVLKRFGPGDPAPLSFPMEGWTLALDLANGPAGLGEMLDDLDVMVAEAGGRVYLAKDSRLRPEMLSTMYPRLDEFQAVRRKVDPAGILVSDMARRLGLLGMEET